jgi:membrane protein YqaA with SNARE-associated domain
MLSANIGSTLGGSTDWTFGRSSQPGTAPVLWSVMLPCSRKQEQSYGHSLVLGSQLAAVIYVELTELTMVCLEALCTKA